MSEVLVVDDDAVDRMIIGRVLRDIPDANIHFAEHAEEALAKISVADFDLVITDLRMPRVDGLQLLAAIRESHKSLPVVIVTALGNEELAIEALRIGASDYVDKNDLQTELVVCCERLLRLNHEKKQLAAAKQFAVSGETCFQIPSDRSVVPPLARLLQQTTTELFGDQEAHPTQVGVALEEALLNAVIHGNLEVSSKLRMQDNGFFDAAIMQRQQDPRYGNRKVYVTFTWSQDEVRFRIRDEGPGFNVEKLPDPTDPENLLKPSGRGVLLMRTFMTDVRYNETGNDVTMVRSYNNAESATAVQAEAKELALV